jgi:hypothetical protein
MNHWLIALSPFLLGALIIGTIKACEWWGKFQYERARRIRNEKLAQYGMRAFRGTKDRFL